MRGFVWPPAGHVMARAAMAAPTAVQRESIGMIVVPVLALLSLRLTLMLWCLPAGNERGEPVHIAIACASMRRARLMRLWLGLLGVRPRGARQNGVRGAVSLRGNPRPPPPP